MICLAYLGNIATRPVYATLFSGLEPKDAGYIVEKLKTMKVPYKIEDQGGTIKVPERQVYEARIQLAGNGALGGTGMGFELFDQNKFGQTDFEQQVGYQRAIQEELRRTIVQFEGISQARVHLVIPQKSVFVSEQGTPTASVALKLQPWARLKPEQVQGICDLITGSVEGLKPENVHIIDAEGNVLSNGLKSSDPQALVTRASLDQQKAQREYEDELEKRVQQMLARIVGYDEDGRVNAISMVTAQLDFSQRQTTSTSTANPDNLKVSEHVVKETTNGNDGGSPPGTDSLSIPFAQGGSSNFSREENTVNYQANTKQETVVEAPGKVRRLSTAVVVKDNGDMPVDVQKIKEVVAAAIGYDQSRGDQINVSSMLFDTSYQEGVKRGLTTAEESSKQKEKFKTYAIAGGALLTVIMAVLVAFILSRRRRRRYAEDEVIELVQPKVLEIDREHQVQRDEKQLQVKEMAKEKPEYVAEILRIWIREKGG